MVGRAKSKGPNIHGGDAGPVASQRQPRWRPLPDDIAVENDGEENADAGSDADADADAGAASANVGAKDGRKREGVGERREADGGGQGAGGKKEAALDDMDVVGADFDLDDLDLNFRSAVRVGVKKKSNEKAADDATVVDSHLVVDDGSGSGSCPTKSGEDEASMDVVVTAVGTVEEEDEEKEATPREEGREHGDSVPGSWKHASSNRVSVVSSGDSGGGASGDCGGGSGGDGQRKEVGGSPSSTAEG